VHETQSTPRRPDFAPPTWRTAAER
jgi:hypothetical protein